MIFEFESNHYQIRYIIHNIVHKDALKQIARPLPANRINAHSTFGQGSGSNADWLHAY